MQGSAAGTGTRSPQLQFEAHLAATALCLVTADDLLRKELFVNGSLPAVDAEGMTAAAAEEYNRSDMAVGPTLALIGGFLP
jgi:hypothetical protein